MEIKAKRDNLLAALYWTQSIVERRNTMPILANVLIESKKGDIRVSATDLEVGVRGRIDGDVVKEGAITLNAKKLYEIVREAPEESMQIKRLENDWAEIKSGKSVFKIVGLDAKEFPQFPKFAGEKLSSVPVGLLREMIEKTLFAASTDETRYNLNGVYVEELGGGKLRMVSTDGHRLALIDREVGALGLNKGAILPKKGLSELKKLLEEANEGLVSIGVKENMALMVKDEVELFMRLIEGEFPDYGKVIPKGNPLVVKVEHQEFLQALRRVSILSSDRYKGVKIEFKEGKVSISASNPDLGEAVEEIEIDYHGKALGIGFNARYIIDVLSVLKSEGEVAVEVKDEMSPSVIKKEEDAGYLYVVMPMRL